MYKYRPPIKQDLKSLQKERMKNICLIRGVRRITPEVVSDIFENEIVIPGLKQLSNKNEQILIRIFWFIVIISCLSLCIYQIGSRISYYFDGAITADVYLNEIEKEEMPVLTICSRDTKALIKYSEKWPQTRNPACYIDIENYLNSTNVSVDAIWNYTTTSTVIKDMYLSNTGNRVASLDLSNLITVGSICSQVYYNDKVKFGDQFIKMNVLFDYPELRNVTKCADPMFVVAVQHRQRSGFDVTAALTVPVYSKTKLSVVVQKYEFLSTRKEPCDTLKDFENCEGDCIQHMYNKFIPGCRFPFMTKNTQQPYCLTSPKLLKQFQIAFNKFIILNPLVHCNCSRVCSQTFYNTIMLTDSSASEVIQLSITDKTIRTVLERHSYDFVSLLCDSGGNLNLFLGLSCLSIFTLVWQMVKNKLSKKKKSLLYRKVYCILHKKFATRSNYFTLIKNKKFCGSIFTIHMLKLITRYSFIIVATLLSLYQTHDRVNYYLSYPTFISIETVIDVKIEIPSIVSCTSIVGTTMFWRNKVAKKKNITCENVHFLDLLDLPSKYANNPEKLWMASSSLGEFIPEHKHIEVGNLSWFSTLFGNCTRQDTEPLEYKGLVSLVISLIQDVKEKCDCHHHAYIIPKGEQFNLRNYIYFPCTSRTDTKFIVKTLLRLNLPGKPCRQTTDVLNCENTCFEKKLRESKIICKLPFMTSLDLPLCTTSDSAKATQITYLKAYLQTKPIEDCGCHLRCRENIYLPFTQHNLNKREAVSTISIYRLQNNFREVIKQNQAFSEIKLVCDIGSTWGFLLGISVLSLMNYMLHSTHQIKKIINDL